MRRKSWFVVTAIVFAGGCDRARPPSGGAGASPSASAAVPRVVHVALGVQTDAKIRTERVGREVLGRTVELAGEIVSHPDRTARVSSPVGGRLEAIRFGEGALVKKGELLAVLRVPDLGRIRGALAASAAKASAARADAVRSKTLAAKSLATEQSYLDAEAEALALEAESASLREQLAAMGVAAEGGSGHQLLLRAPVDGVVVSREAVVGQPMRSDQTIATLADLSRVWFIGQVFERDMPLVDVGASSRVRLTALPDRVFDAHVELVGRALDPSTRSANVRIPLDNADGAIRLAMTGVARVTSLDPKESADAGSSAVLSVPRAAVTDFVGHRVVFVRKGPEDFELRDVETAGADRDRVGVARGLVEEDEVVVDGVFTLKSLALKSTFAEE